MVSCPICGSDKNRASLAKVSFTYGSEFDLSECSDCGVLFYDPVPSIDQLVIFYSREAYDYNRWKEEIKAGVYIKKLNYRHRQGRFLDIGCATGYFINGIGNGSEWEVYGVELSKRPAEFARDTLGLANITHGDLISAEYPDSYFDCIHIGDVLEHVPDPVQILKECRRIIKTDGALYLDIPNGTIDSRGLIRYHRVFNEAPCHASGHIFFFPINTLHYLFEKTGFRVEKSRTTGLKHGLRSLGLLPRKIGWRNLYKPRIEPEVARDDEIFLIDKKVYPGFYYQYRYLKHAWFFIPGMHNIGLDFVIELAPVKK